MAKQIIRVALKTRKVEVERCETELLAVGMYSDIERLDRMSDRLDLLLNGAIRRLKQLGDFKGKEGTSAVIYGNEAIGAGRVLLVGLGEKKKAALDTIRKAAGHAANQAVGMKASTMAVILHQAFGGRFDLDKTAQVIAEGVYFGSYRYDEFVTCNENKGLSSIEVELIDADAAKIRKLKKGLAVGVTIGQAQSYARTTANRPGNVINPATLASQAKKLARDTEGLSCTVFDEKQLADKGMGAILAVGSGSVNKPRLIVLKYTSVKKSASKLPAVGLVGKAVTFDSGGISIKPWAKMDQMKLDKSGGAAVLGTMKAAAEMKLGLNVYGIIPAVENLPSATSYRPGDIIKTYSGKTVEVLSTDAEGRMILCDGLAYAVEQKCDPIIDIATLTGACMVALGRYMAGLMSNDGKLIRQLQTAAKESGEKVWHMPSGKDYLEEMKSKIADLRNIGSKWGGACTAAAFLARFVGESSWAHLDMAGVDIFEKADKFVAEGSSGFGVRLLTTYLMNLAAK